MFNQYRHWSHARASMRAMQGSWTAYVQGLTRGLQQKDVAAATSIDSSVISRWLDPHSESQPRADKVIIFARAMNADPIEALVAAGYLTNQDVGANAQVSLSSIELMSTDELQTELKRLFNELSARIDDTVKPRRGKRVNRQAPPL